MLPLVHIQNSNGIDVKLQMDTASDITMIAKSLCIKMGKLGQQVKNCFVTSVFNNKIKLLTEF